MPDPTPPATQTQSPTLAVIVGFNFDQGEPDEALPPLRGMVNDAIAWWRLLRGMGVPGRNVLLITDQPVEALGARLKQEGLGDPDLLSRGLCCARTAGEVRAALEHFAWQLVPLPDPSAFEPAQQFDAALYVGQNPVTTLMFGGPQGAPLADARLLIAWSGHGGAVGAGDGRDTCPALFTPDGDHLSLAGLLLTGTPDDARPRQASGPPKVVAFIGACHTGASLVPSAADQDALQTAGTFGVPTLSASAEVRLAHEFEIDGIWRGAMAWAVTTTLSRFKVNADGSIALSYSELYHRVRALLSAIDVADEPLLFVPVGELNRRILRRPLDHTIGGREAEDGATIEIYPVGGYRITSAPPYPVERGRLYITDAKGRAYPTWSGDSRFPEANALYVIPEKAKGLGDDVFADDFVLRHEPPDAATLSKDREAVARKAPGVKVYRQKPWARAAEGATTDASHAVEPLDKGGAGVTLYFEARDDALWFFADQATPGDKVVPLFAADEALLFKAFPDGQRPKRLSYRFIARDPKVG